MSPGADAIDVGILKERLADTVLHDDPTDVVPPPGIERIPHYMRRLLSQPLKPAGVLIPLFERPSGIAVLLTERSADLKNHAGQISFPGGQMEDGDPDIAATALRETFEEVGIAPELVEVFGYMRAMPTITGYAVTPVVGRVATEAELRLDPTEVESAFEVPLEFLLDVHNARRGERRYKGRTFPTVEYRFEGHRIWGATASIIVQFSKIVMKQ
jgi:8-oxo-dGTP pyrophosphatase MutT (NUDIX family)